MEKGEQCDCGTKEECRKNGKDRCCNPRTCQLHPSAKCVDGPCCDNCRPKPRGHQCRRSYDSECDLPEYCPGNSTQCPANFYVRDTTPCDNNNGMCHSGVCRSHDRQCKELWGPSAYKGNYYCYKINTRSGDAYANCETVKKTKEHKETYKGCAYRDFYCGKLQCSGNISWPLVPNPGIWVKSIKFSGYPRCSMCYISTKKDEVIDSVFSFNIYSSANPAGEATNNE